MKEMSVRCEGLTQRGSQCSKPAYEPAHTTGGRVFLCTVHRRRFDGPYGRVRVVHGWANRSGAGWVMGDGDA